MYSKTFTQLLRDLFYKLSSKKRQMIYKLFFNRSNLFFEFIDDLIEAF